MPAGRPTKYKDDYAGQAYKLCLLGATDKQLADFFNTSEQTINAWKKKHSDFLESIKRGKVQADAKVAESLFHRACGYSHPEDKIFNNNGEEMIVATTKHYPPDATAAIFWLKNRDKENWRDQKEINGKFDHEHTHTHESVSETAQWINGLLGTDAKGKAKKPRAH